MTMYKTKIFKRDFEAYDQRFDQSTIREIEMAVDALVAGEQGYCGQFFYDLQVYGLKEAKMYLLDFVKAKWGDSRHAEETRFHEVVDSALRRMGRQE